MCPKLVRTSSFLHFFIFVSAVLGKLPDDGAAPFCSEGPPDSGSIPPSKQDQLTEYPQEHQASLTRNDLQDQESLKAWIDAGTEERANLKASECREAPSNYLQVTVFTVVHDQEASFMNRIVAFSSRLQLWFHQLPMLRSWFR